MLLQELRNYTNDPKLKKALDLGLFLRKSWEKYLDLRFMSGLRKQHWKKEREEN